MPIWVLTGVLDFADLSKLFKGMNAPDQQAIMSWFGIERPPYEPDAKNRGKRKDDQKLWRNRPPLANWLMHLTVVRNTCAHHGRLWNRQLPPATTPTHLPGFEGLPTGQFERVYGTICLISFLFECHLTRAYVDT